MRQWSRRGQPAGPGGRRGDGAGGSDRGVTGAAGGPWGQQGPPVSFSGDVAGRDCVFGGERGGVW